MAIIRFWHLNIEKKYKFPFTPSSCNFIQKHEEFENFSGKSVNNDEKYHAIVIFMANKGIFSNVICNFTPLYLNCVTMERKLNRIKTALVDQGKTNKWLAEQLGKDPATVSKWCTNVSQPSLEMMMRIAKLLNVEMNDLVRLEAMPDPVVKSDKTNKK